MAHTCNPRTWEVEAELSGVQDYPSFVTSLKPALATWDPVLQIIKGYTRETKAKKNVVQPGSIGSLAKPCLNEKAKHRTTRKK